MKSKLSSFFGTLLVCPKPGSRLSAGSSLAERSQEEVSCLGCLVTRDMWALPQKPSSSMTDICLKVWTYSQKFQIHHILLYYLRLSAKCLPNPLRSPSKGKYTSKASHRPPGFHRWIALLVASQFAWSQKTYLKWFSGAQHDQYAPLAK